MARMGLLLSVALVAAACMPAAQAWVFETLPCDSVCTVPSTKCTPKSCAATDGNGTLAHYKIPMKTNVCANFNTPAPYTKGTAGNCGAVQKTSPNDCCSSCASTAGCTYWQFAKIEGSDCGMCFYYFDGKTPKCATKAAQVLQAPSYVGGSCNPSVSGDPHLIGARGTEFDFVGAPDRSFCVVSDKSLHINVGLVGYTDSNLNDAILIKDGKAVHTWVKVLGIVWQSGSEEHTFKITARSGPQVARGGGFLKGAEFDGKMLTAPMVGEEFSFAGGLKLKFIAREKDGPFDVDHFSLSIDGLLDLDLHFRVAQPKLRTAEEAYAHIDIGFGILKRSNTIHGVLGQTYRTDLNRDERAAAFQKLVHQLHADHVAVDDSHNGNNFLDGQPSDYISSTILSTDCHFSTYGSQELVSVSSE